VQFGAFSAALRLHSTGVHRDRRPWLWGDLEKEAMRKAFHLRSQFFPYIYTAVRRCHEQSMPLLRPMYLDFPEQELAYQYDLQHFLGNDLLVVPVITPLKPGAVVKKTIWFPEGRWCNFFTVMNALLQTGSSRRAPAPPEKRFLNRNFGRVD